MKNLKNKMQICLFYDFKQRKTAAESYWSLSNAFENNVINERCNWYQSFWEGDESLADKERAGRLKMIDNAKHKEAINSTLNTQQRKCSIVIVSLLLTICTVLERWINAVNKCPINLAI